MSYFKKSHIILDNLGVPRLKEFTSNVIIKGVDFAEAKAKNKIEYRDDGVYLNVNGEWVRGYYFMSSYRIGEYGNPRFHLFDCSTMQNKSMYIGNYIWSNDKTVNVKDRDTKVIKEELILPLCNNCRSMLTENINSTQEFYDSNDYDNTSDIVAATELTIFGYPKNWKEIATKFKTKKGLVCSHCKFKDESAINKWFFDVDHINGNKSECKDSNLQVLCKLCHVYKDEHHRTQAVKYPNRNEILHEFIRKNKNDLTSNSFLSKYHSDFDEFLNIYN